MIEAMPAILARHPETTYLVAGRTHPTVALREGERYRLMLERRVLDLGIEGHVVFDDRYLSIEALASMLADTDVFVTLYRNREQISSGALTFAVAAGCAVVSTPYWYATDVLGTGAGKTVPFAEPDAFADAICDFLDDPDALEGARAEARRVGAALAWPSVARQTIEVVREASAAAPRDTSIAPLDAVPRDVRFDHLHVLVDDVGIIQHATGSIPNRSTGYCVDDVARLVVVATELGRREPDLAWGTMVNRGIAFLADATSDGTGGMRNFMAYDRRWLDEPHHGDHVGRTVWALGEVLGTAWVPALVAPTSDLLGRIIDGFEPTPSLRTASYAILGLARLDGDRIGARGRVLLTRLLAQIEGAYDEASSGDWQWFENRLTYDNARLPQALIVGGVALGNQASVDRGLESLRWLGDECGLADGLLRLIGHEGRDRGTPGPGGGDEQPLDAAPSSRPSLRRTRAPVIPNTVPAPTSPSTGSSGGTASGRRSTTSRRVVVATGSHPTTRASIRVRSRRSHSTARISRSIRRGFRACPAATCASQRSSRDTD